MSKEISSFSKKIPPCPAPGYYILIRTKEGVYWRLKRGLAKPAALNTTMEWHAKLLKRSSPAASAMVQALRPYLQSLECGRITVRFSTFLRKSLLAGKETDLSYFQDHDLQSRFPLGNLWRGRPEIIRKKNKVALRLNVNGRDIHVKNSLVDGYYFRAVLLSGDPLKGGPLVITEERSPVYRLVRDYEECILWQNLPEKGPWILFFKVSCLEEGKPAHHPRHYGMKVVEVGE